MVLSVMHGSWLTFSRRTWGQEWAESERENMAPLLNVLKTIPNVILTKPWGRRLLIPEFALWLWPWRKYTVRQLHKTSELEDWRIDASKVPLGDSVTAWAWALVYEHFPTVPAFFWPSICGTRAANHIDASTVAMVALLGKLIFQIEPITIAVWKSCCHGW